MKATEHFLSFSVSFSKMVMMVSYLKAFEASLGDCSKPEGNPKGTDVKPRESSYQH